MNPDPPCTLYFGGDVFVAPPSDEEFAPPSLPTAGFGGSFADATGFALAAESATATAATSLLEDPARSQKLADEVFPWINAEAILLREPAKRLVGTYSSHYVWSPCCFVLITLREPSSMFSSIRLCSTIEQVMPLIYGEAEEISVGPASHPEDPGYVEVHGPRRDGARAEGKGVIIWHVIKTLKLVMCIHILYHIQRTACAVPCA